MVISKANSVSEEFRPFTNAEHRVGRAWKRIAVLLGGYEQLCFSSKSSREAAGGFDSDALRK